MPDRSKDWLRQAEADLGHARSSRALGDHDWACFSAHQAAGKADIGVTAALVDRAKVLDKHYIPARYPSGFDAGAPTDLYTVGEADTAIAIAGEIIEFCKGVLAR